VTWQVEGRSPSAERPGRGAVRPARDAAGDFYPLVGRLTGRLCDHPGPAGPHALAMPNRIDEPRWSCRVFVNSVATTA